MTANENSQFLRDIAEERAREEAYIAEMERMERERPHTSYDEATTPFIWVLSYNEDGQRAFSGLTRGITFEEAKKAAAYLVWLGRKEWNNGSPIE